MTQEGTQGREPRRRRRRWLAVLAAAAALTTGSLVAARAPAHATTTTTDDLQSCALPAAGAQPATAAPGAEGFDPTKLAQAMAFAETRLRLHVKVFRNNCSVGSDPLDAFTQTVPWNIWSSTKSVISMLAGIAATEGRLDLGAPIGRYLPPGLGDAAHRAITVRDLLTETSGLQQSIGTEAPLGVVGADPDIVKEALSLPIVARPGTYFQYSQDTPDLLAYVVQRAVGQDLQAFAQRHLFGPLGIPASDYVWLRDRSGNTYGFANLYLPPDDFARLGLLMVNDGSWDGRRIISPAYIARATTPSATNACYGYLFWLNRTPCIGPSFPSRQTFDASPLDGLGSDAYAMVGFLQQNNFIVPSLHLVVTWTGVLGDVSVDPQTLLSASPNSELYHDFFRLLVEALVRPTLPTPGPYQQTFNLDIAPDQFANPAILLGALGLGADAPPDCNILVCDGTIPLTGAADNVQALLRALIARTGGS